MDIWSLGVVVFERAYGLPERGRKTVPFSWCRKIIRAVEDWEFRQSGGPSLNQNAEEGSAGQDVCQRLFGGRFGP